jgi:hypothetical protein
MAGAIESSNQAINAATAGLGMAGMAGRRHLCGRQGGPTPGRRRGGGGSDLRGRVPMYAPAGVGGGAAAVRHHPPRLPEAHKAGDGEIAHLLIGPQGCAARILHISGAHSSAGSPPTELPPGPKAPLLHGVVLITIVSKAPLAVQHLGGLAIRHGGAFI